MPIFTIMSLKKAKAFLLLNYHVSSIEYKLIYSKEHAADKVPCISAGNLPISNIVLSSSRKLRAAPYSLKRAMHKLIFSMPMKMGDSILIIHYINKPRPVEASSELPQPFSAEFTQCLKIPNGAPWEKSSIASKS